MNQLFNALETPQKTVSTYLIQQIIQAINTIRFGSVTVYIQNHKIVQITEQNIKKPTDDTKPTVNVNNKIAS